MTKKILVVCATNSIKSQIAQGMIQHFVGRWAKVYSGGVKEGALNPLAVESMDDVGLDISGQSHHYTEDYDNVLFDFIITLDSESRELMPYAGGGALKGITNIEDPILDGSSNDKARMNKCRDSVRDYCRVFCKMHFTGVKANPKGKAPNRRGPKKKD